MKAEYDEKEFARAPATADPAGPTVAPTTASPEVPSSPKPNRKPVLLGILFFVAIVVGVYVYRFLAFASWHAATDDAYITSNIVELAPEVGGTISKVFVKENDRVQAGQLLAQIDDTKYQAAVDQAKANLDLAIAQSQGAKTSTSLTNQTGAAQIEQAHGILQESSGGAGAAVADAARARAGIVWSRANVSTAKAGVAGAGAALSTALANRQRALQGVVAAQAELTTALAGVKSAQSALVSTQATANKAVSDARRVAQLYAQGAASGQESDAAKAAAEVAGANVATAKQQVAAAESVVDQRKSDIVAAKSQVDAADSSVAQARAQIDAAKGQLGASQMAVQQAQDQARMALGNVAAARGKTSQARGGLSQAETSRTQVQLGKNAEAQADARVEQARAALKQAQIDLSRTKIYAPASGLVTKKLITAGMLVQTGAPMLAIISDGAPWVVANYKETQLASVRVGQEVDIEVDAFPKHSFKGKVDSLSAGTGSQFALLPADNATGNFTKVVQRLPIKIVFEAGQPDLDKLRAGMSVVSSIATK